MPPLRAVPAGLPLPRNLLFVDCRLLFIAENPLLPLLLTAFALATEPHAGIDPSDLDDVLGDVVYLAPEAGWAASLADEKGRVRVFVAPTVEGAETWITSRRDRHEGPPRFPISDEGWGNGHSLVLFRDANVVVEIARPGGDADEIAWRLEAAIGGDDAWPDDPELTLEGGEARVAGDWARVTWQAAPLPDPKTLLPRPVEVIPTGDGEAVVQGPTRRLEVTVWDDYGRWARSAWSAE